MIVIVSCPDPSADVAKQYALVSGLATFFSCTLKSWQSGLARYSGLIL